MYSKLFCFILLTLCFGLSSCVQTYSGGDDDDDLRTVPVTNNPNVVPNHGSGLPMMPKSPM